MIFRILWVLVFMGLGLLMAGANARHMTDISVLLYTWKNVSVYSGILIAFAAGILWSIPFFLRKKRKKKIVEEDPGLYSPEETGE